MLLLSFKSFLGTSQLYISRDYIYYESKIDTLKDGILIDLTRRIKYQITSEGKYEIPMYFEQPVISKFDPYLQIIQDEQIDTISFLGYSCLKKSGIIKRINYTGRFVTLTADLPEINKILPSLQDRKLLPIVKNEAREPYLFEIYLSEKTLLEGNEETEELILNELTSIETILMDEKFFVDISSIPTIK